MRRLHILQLALKAFCIVSLLIVAVPRGSSGQEEIDPEYVKGLEERTRETKELIARLDRQAKPEEGIVVYIVLEGDKVAPAFLNGTLRTVHRWDGVILKVSDVPTRPGWLEMQWGGPPIIWPWELDEVTVKSIAPPVRYLKMDDGTFVCGYYDHTSRILYQSSDAFLQEAELPPTAVKEKLLVDRQYHAHQVKLRDGRVIQLMPVPQPRKPEPKRPDRKGSSSN